MPKVTIFSYADDTAVTSTAKSWNEAKDNLIRYLQKISPWLTALKKL